MAKTLSTLMKVLGWRVDLQQRQLAEAERQAERLHRQERELVAEIEGEQAAARAASPGPANTYAAYARMAIERGKRLKEGIAGAHANITDQQAALREAFAARKRLEIVLERRRQEENAEAARRQQRLLDEMAQSRYLRREIEP